MATFRLPILGASTIPDSGVFQLPINTQITNGTAPADELCFVLDNDPATDLGISGKFSVPKGYVGSPVLVYKGIVDGTVGTEDIRVGIQLLGLADNEAYDAAFEAEDLGTFQSDAYTDEDVFEATITLTVTLAEDDSVGYHFFCDASGSTPFTGNLLITALEFQYADA